MTPEELAIKLADIYSRAYEAVLIDHYGLSAAFIEAGGQVSAEQARVAHLIAEKVLDSHDSA